MRHLAIVLALGACATPDKLAADDCGNGVVDPGEDCEPFSGQPGTCAAPGAPNACHFTCSAADTCPPGYGCGHDGVCRQSTGAFAEAKGSPFAGEFEATAVADFNGDGVPDVVTGANFDGTRIAFGSTAHDGSFPSSAAFPVAYNGQLGVGDFDGDGIADLGIDTLQGLAIMRGSTANTLVSLTEPAFTPSHGSFTNGDLEIPMHPDPTSPFQELLHLSYFKDEVSLSFDQPNTLFGSLPGDPAPVAFGGLHNFFTFAGPIQFPVADLDGRTDLGGDEIVVGFPDDTVIHVLTAHSVNGHGLPATLINGVDIPSWPGTFVAPAQIADIDGDGRLDIACTVRLPDNTIHVAVSRNLGFKAWGAPAVDPSYDQFLDRAGQFAGDANGDFKLVNLAGDARADIVAFEGDQIFTRTGAGGFELAGLVPNACVFPIDCETVTPDLNRDGFPDVVMNSTTGLAIDYGGAAGVFDQAFVLTPGAPFNLRVGDFDGDRIQDVMFLISDGPDSTSMYVLYGGTTGVPGAATKIATWSAVDWVEPVLLGADQTANPIDFTNEDAITDIVVMTNPVNHFSQATLMLGSASRSLLSMLGLVLQVPAVVPGRFTAGATTDEALLPGQGVASSQSVHDYQVLDFPTDGGSPTQRQTNVNAFANSRTFDAVACTLYAHGDVDGDGVEEVIALESCDPERSTNGVGPSAAELLVISTGGAAVTTQPVQTKLAQVFVTALHVADVDNDGHLDLVAVFAGDSATCIDSDGSTKFPCEAGKSGVVVMFGDGSGGFGTSVVLPSPAQGEPLDVAAINVDGDPELELAVAYQQGVVIFDQAARAFTPAAAVAFPLDTVRASLATADLDGNGTTDLVVNENGTVHALLAAPVVH